MRCRQSGTGTAAGLQGRQASSTPYSDSTRFPYRLPISNRHGYRNVPVEVSKETRQRAQREAEAGMSLDVACESRQVLHACDPKPMPPLA